MENSNLEVAGLATMAVTPASVDFVGDFASKGTMVVLLHGYAMKPTDLAPFARSMNVPALFLFPEAPLAAPMRSSLLGGRAWWSIDTYARTKSMRRGPRDFADEHPAGLAEARSLLSAFLLDAAARFLPRRILLGGFSQGGMLSCDCLLHDPALPIDGLMLMSASRLGIRDWTPRRDRLRGLPVFVSHGERDPDLAFSAGEQLREFLASAGAHVTWAPFPGGHEIPLVAWRALRKFLRGFC